MGNHVTLGTSDSTENASRRSQPRQPSRRVEEPVLSTCMQHGDQRPTRNSQPKDIPQRQHAEKHRQTTESRTMRQRQELKLEESRIMRQRQELNAMLEESRNMRQRQELVLEESRIMRQRQELNAMLEESRTIRQRQELSAMLEEQERRLEEQRRRDRETQRLQEERARTEKHDKSKVPNLRPSLPGVCPHYSSRQGCKDPNCRGLHICRQFLADICNYGSACRYNHSLTTVHNQVIFNTCQVDTSRVLVLLQQLRRAFEESDGHKDGMFINNLTRCYKFRSKDPCEAPQCNRIHICRQFVVGACERNPNNCRNGHDLHTAHNQEVLRRHRLMKMTDTEILNILREKEETRMADQASRNAAATGSTTSGAASAGPDRRGAVPRSRPSGQRGGPLQPRWPRQLPQPRQPSQPSARFHPLPRDGLSDELQCPICLEMFNRATTLGCGHTFCSACLQDVKDRSGNRCPLCRASITSAIRSVTLDNVIRSVTVQQ